MHVRVCTCLCRMRGLTAWRKRGEREGSGVKEVGGEGEISHDAAPLRRLRFAGCTAGLRRSLNKVGYWHSLS